MNRLVLRRTLILALAIPLLGLSSLSQRSLNHDRERMQLTHATPLENAPPALAFTTMVLGGFRGIIANALWMRASDLQEEEKFFELIQLADWITKLQPRNPAVWSFQSWNLAYNVSVKFPDHQSRWIWVREGVSLLRDQGLRYNPNNADLHYRLAYLYQHKLAGDQDSAHRFYKRSWIHEMESLFHGPRPDWEELLNPSTPDAAERARRLREDYKLDPAEMKRIDTKYGPLEWRLPESHAIYWASYALEHCHSDRPIDLRRVVYQSLQLAVRRGRLIDFPEIDDYVYAPDPSKITSANNAYLEMIRADPGHQKNIGDAHKNFLLFAITLLDGTAMKTQAHQWFDYMLANYPDAMAEYGSYREMIRKRLVEGALQGGPDKVPTVLRALATQYLDYQIMEQGDLALLMKEKAENVHEAYLERFRRANEERIRIPTWKQILDDVVRERTQNPPPIGYPYNLAAKLCLLRGIPYPAKERQAATPEPFLPPGTSYKTGSPAENLKAAQIFMDEMRESDGIESFPSGMLWKIVDLGSGKNPHPDSTIRARIIGHLWNEKIVQSTDEANTGKPMVFKLSMLCPGVQEAFCEMKVGGRRKLYLPPKLAYGKNGQPSENIPFNAAMWYDIKLVNVLD